MGHIIFVYCGFMFLYLNFVTCQYPVDDPKYQEVMDESTKDLNAFIETHEDVELIIHPDRAMIYTDQYVFAEPETEDYRIGIIIDPVMIDGSSDMHLSPILLVSISFI